jgi:hypothetical protein
MESMEEVKGEDQAVAGVGHVREACFLEIGVEEVVCGGVSTESEEDTMGLKVVDADVEAVGVS